MNFLRKIFNFRPMPTYRQLLREILSTVEEIEFERKVDVLVLDKLNDNYIKFREDFDKTITPTHPTARGIISEIQIGEQPKEGKYFHNTNKIKGTIMALTLTDSQQAVGTLAFTDKKGATVNVADENVTVTSSDPSIATATYADGSVTVVAVTAGVATLSISATDPGGDAVPFADTAIEVTAGEATGGTVTFGTPTEQ